ncbi:MAG: hypothetical protein JXA15_07660 [Spirochaetales bacterium]|nr:hypothetical protein [Spirochaetales bacterium]
MPIKPIDLQTLFSQLEQVGRERAAGKDGNVGILQQSLQGMAQLKKREEEAKAVRKPESSDDGAPGVNEREGGSREGKAGARREKDEAADEAAPNVISDPDLGSRVDISG